MAHRDPMKTRNGKPRLGPLNLAQLQQLLEQSSRPRDRARVRSRIQVVEGRAAKQSS